MWSSNNASGRRVFPATSTAGSANGPPETCSSKQEPTTEATTKTKVSTNVEPTSNIYGFNRLMMMRELNANYDADRERSILGTASLEGPPIRGVRGPAGGAGGARGDVSASQNHRERIEQEAKRRKELELMQAEDFIFKAEGVERAKRRNDQLGMQQEERRMLRLIQLEREAKQKQLLLAQQQLEMAQKEQFLLKIQEQKREQERVAKDKEAKRRAAAELRMKEMKEAADAQMREKYRREQEAVEAEARRRRQIELEALEEAQREAARVRQLEMEALESASMQVEDQFSANYRRFLAMEQERKAQLALEEAKWKEFEANQAKQLKMETEARRAERAEKAKLYEETQKKKMAKHQQLSKDKDKSKHQLVHQQGSKLRASAKDHDKEQAQVQDQQLKEEQTPCCESSSSSPSAEEPNVATSHAESSTVVASPPQRAASEDPSPSQSTPSAPEPSDKPTAKEDSMAQETLGAPSQQSTPSTTEAAGLTQPEQLVVEAPGSTTTTTEQQQETQPAAQPTGINDAQSSPSLATPSPGQPASTDEPTAGPSLAELSKVLTVTVRQSQLAECNLVPFAKVLTVAPCSPAMDANLHANDLVAEFDGVVSTTPKSLVRMGEIVQSKVNQPIHLTVLRQRTTSLDPDRELLVVELQLIPHQWAGKGLLGCNLAPFKAEEPKPKAPPTAPAASAASAMQATTAPTHEQQQTPSAEEAKALCCSPFLVVDNVRPGSPAHAAGLLQGDLVVDFEGICADTPNKMKLVAQKVSSRVNAQVHLRVARKRSPDLDVYRLVELVLVPQKWQGDGLLGCKIGPYAGPAVKIQEWVAEDPAGSLPPVEVVAPIAMDALETSVSPEAPANDDPYLGCLVFYQIADDSPAQEAGLMDGDILMTCGPLTNRPLELIEVQKFLISQVNQRVAIHIQRLNMAHESTTPPCDQAEAFDLCLLPQSWSGDGILGCSLTTYEQYYDVPGSPAPDSPAPSICEQCWYSAYPTCAHAAAWNGHVECLEAIVSMKDPAIYQLLFNRDEEGRTPLFYACSANHVPCVIVLWDETYAPKHPVVMVDPDHSFMTDGAEVPPQNLTSLFKVTCDYFGDTLLHAASTTNAIDVLRLLLEHGADADVTNLDQMTPAHVAANAASLRILKAFGADLLKLDVYGKLPLSYACMVGSVDSVRFLCECHDDFVDYADQEGNTPLHLAVLYDHLDVIAILVKFLTPIAFYLPNAADLNPMQLATNPDVVTLLEAYYDPTYEPPV